MVPWPEPQKCEQWPTKVPTLSGVNGSSLVPAVPMSAFRPRSANFMPWATSVECEHEDHGLSLLQRYFGRDIFEALRRDLDAAWAVGGVRGRSFAERTEQKKTGYERDPCKSGKKN